MHLSIIKISTLDDIYIILGKHIFDVIQICNYLQKYGFIFNFYYLNIKKTR
jgi:hypothetical protein